MPESSGHKIQVLVAADFSEEIIRHLRSVSDQLEIHKHFPDVPDSAYTNAEILYTIRSFPTPAQAPNLRWIQVHYAGVERVLERPIMSKPELRLTSASGIHMVQMAEYCLAMMLSFMYKLPQMQRFQSQSKWPENAHEIFNPSSLRGLTLGIAGYGSIGRELARMADALGMTVLATKRDLRTLSDESEYSVPGTGDPEGDIPERIYPSEALGSMVEDCDFVVITVPLTDTTRHMVNEQILHRMKKTAVLINVARGGVVDEEALIKVLKNKKIGGAALDVFETEPLPADSPLWKLENVLISPHVSGGTSNYHQKAADLFAENLRRYVAKQPLLNQVDMDRGY